MSLLKISVVNEVEEIWGLVKQVLPSGIFRISNVAHPSSVSLSGGCHVQDSLHFQPLIRILWDSSLPETACRKHSGYSLSIFNGAGPRESLPLG